MRRSIFVVPFVLFACSSGSGGFESQGGVDSGGGGDAGGGGDGSTSSDSGSPMSDGGAPMGDAGSGVDAAPGTSMLRVHYPAGTHHIALRGSAGPLNWTTGVALTAAPNDTWTYDFGVLAAPLELKPLLDDTTWSRGPNYKLAPGQTIDIYPHFITVAGSYSVKWAAFTSTVLPSTRSIRAYLPPSYDENTLAKFPVVYMHDGQNLFDASTAFGGNEWKVDETLNAAAEDGTIREAIVIGIDNDSDRINELTPTYDASTGAGGKADLYLRMIVEELKPMVDAQLRTLPSRDQTAILGSSLGGLVSAYAGVKHADVFGIVGAMSPSTWWDNTMIIATVGTMPTQSSKPLLVYVDSGDSGTSNDDVTNTAALAQKFRDVGYVDGSTLKYLVQAGGQHNEIYWAQRLPGALAFLLGARNP
jgi:predicted alpha/beta superfamily hydrolase